MVLWKRHSYKSLTLQNANLSAMLRPSAGHYSEAIKGISVRIDKILVGPTLAMLLVSSLALAADFETGLKAYRSGNFKTALTQWFP